MSKITPFKKVRDQQEPLKKPHTNDSAEQDFIGAIDNAASKPPKTRNENTDIENFDAHAKKEVVNALVSEEIASMLDEISIFEDRSLRKIAGKILEEHVPKLLEKYK